MMDLNTFTHACMHARMHKFVYLKIPRLDSSDLLIAQLVARQTSIHEIVGSESHSEVNIFKFKSRARAYGVFPPPFSPKTKTHKRISPIPRTRKCIVCGCQSPRLILDILIGDNKILMLPFVPMCYK